MRYFLILHGDSLNLPEYLEAKFPDGPNSVQQILDQHHQAVIALNSSFNLLGADEAGRTELLAFARWQRCLIFPSSEFSAVVA